MVQHPVGCMGTFLIHEICRTDISGRDRGSSIQDHPERAEFRPESWSGQGKHKNPENYGGTNNLVAENLSDKPLYFNLVRKGTPLVSDQSAADNGLSLRVDYTDTGLKPVDQRNLVQGTDFMMVTKVTNTSFDRVDNIALTQMVPSGWEILNTRMFEADYGIKESPYEYRDIRDDRVNTYFSLNRGESKTFVLILNAAYKGEYYQPAILCEAMYTSGYRSRVPGTRVVVRGQ